MKMNREITAGPRTLVVGCGSIGRRHIRNLYNLGVREFILCDTNKNTLAEAALLVKDLKSVLTTSFKEAVQAEPTAAVICTPSSMHVEMAMTLARKWVHLLIEKPLSHNLEDVDALLKLVKEQDIVAMMAMCYRFHPVMIHIKSLIESEVIGKVYHVNYYGGQYLPDWHPYADYRTEYAARKNLGGGVVLTTIHGLDDLRWLFGEVDTLHAFTDKVSNLEMDVEDMVMGIFRMKSGAYAMWETDYLQRSKQHRIVITGEKGTIRCDLVDGMVETYLSDMGKWFSGKVPFEINTMYVDEMRHFLDCIACHKKPLVDMVEGYKTLRLALEVKGSGANKGDLRKCAEE